MALSTLTIDAARYARDEDLAVVAESDFARIVPESQKLAYGVDGVLNSTDRWALTSASTDFGAMPGVQDGRLVLLRPTVENDIAPGNPGTSQAGRDVLGGEGEYAVIDGVPVANRLPLRRPGAVSGEGQPFGPATGTYLNLRFIVMTFDAQLAWATREVRQRLRALAPDANLAAALDDDGLILTTAFRTLQNTYRAAGRSFALQGSGPDELASKAIEYGKEYEGMLSRSEARIISPGGTAAGSGTGSEGSTGTIGSGTIAARDTYSRIGWPPVPWWCRPY